MASLIPVTGQLGERKAAHLLRRATWGPNISSIKDFAALTADQALTTLFTDPPVPDPPIDLLTSESWVNPPVYPAATDLNSEQTDLFNYFKIWHLEQMRKSGNNLKERLTWFFHTHLPVAWTVINRSEAIYYQNALYRYYAFDSFKDLFKKVCLDNAMLRYIDGETNDKDSPNENFAREMFELYSIGRGHQIAEGNYTNYTEDDIRAACKVLTGWKFDETFSIYDPDTGLPTGELIGPPLNDPLPPNIATRHDPGVKTFSAAFQNQSIQPFELSEGLATKAAALKEFDDLIEMIFVQPETARFLVRKIYRFFVYYDIPAEIETDIITPLADTFRNSGYEIRPLLEQLLKSQHFYDMDNAVTSDDNLGAIIKSPLEVIFGSLRFFDIEMPAVLADLCNKSYIGGILGFISDQGLDLYEPIDVAGYPPYHQEPTFNRDWITPTSLAYRYHFSFALLGNESESPDYGFRLDIVDWVRNSGFISNPADAAILVHTLTDYMFAVELNEERRNYFLNDVFLENLPAATWQNEWNAYIGGGNDTVVRERLETLVAAIMQTPEYQLF
jgi:uncharacterized protein (DUF1800 family)